MANVDLNAVNEELKNTRNLHTNAVAHQLRTEAKKRQAFESARNATANTKSSDGKAPSEAACERVAKSDPMYLKLCEEEINAIESVMKIDTQVEYLRRKFDMYLAVVNQK